jgi:ribonucleotide monophosphatase NagD (HAD superfamily)
MIDIQTGNNAGATSILVLTGYGKEEQTLLQQHHVHAEHVAGNLYEAVQYIKRSILQEQSIS